MKINRVEFKNFASYGNRVQVIEFNPTQSDLYLILGSNGSGKSTLAKVITYLCYGKVEGANLKDLPNRVNNSLWGKIWIESKGNQITIERGISPSVFNVQINNTEYDVAGKSNLQDFLETEMYEIPYHVFKNVIILSVNDFKSFITMSPYDKKQIVDRIFGFSIINEMREIVKSKRRLLLNDIKTFDDEIRTLEESIQSILKKIEQLAKLNIEKNKIKIDELKEKINTLNDNRLKLKDVGEKIKEKIEVNNSLVKQRAAKRSEIKTKIKGTQQALKLYENSSCPTCQGSLDVDFHKHIKHERESELINFESELTEVETFLIEDESFLSKIRIQSNEINVKLGQLETQMKSIKNELIKISQEDTKDESVNLKQLVKDFSSKKELKGTDRQSVESENYYLSILETIMGEDGIKNMALRMIIPSLNNNILLMGKEMGIPFQIIFDEKFNCYLKHIGNEISPKTLSTGERKKADFVIIMALIKMIKVRFPSLNILFLDEIFSSIDADGVYHIINILHKTIHDIGLNTFVINHTVLPSEYFDKKISITKESGFSEILIEAIL